MKKKFFLVIILILMSIFLITNYNRFTSFTSNIKNKIYFKNMSVQRVNNYNKMKIDFINVKNRITGTAPFNTGDSSNENGIDVSDDDDYVRTFDYVKYELELGIVPNTDVAGVKNSSTFKGGVIKVRAKLPNQNDRILMTWEKEAWMKNVSYNLNKTEIYAEYYISDKTDVSNAIQTLSFTFKINGYKSEITKDMAPEFEVWMEGNIPDNNDSTVGSKLYKDERNLIISAKPSYDVDLKASTYLYSGEKDGVVGKYISYGVGVSLIQPYSYIDDLRGVEFPTGKFEIELINKYSYRKYNSEDEFLDVSNKVDTSLIAFSKNREVNNSYYMSSNVYTRNLPKGFGGGEEGVTDSGIFNVSYDNNRTIVSFENYILNNHYPIRNIVERKDKITYTDNIGYFAAGNLQVFVPYYDIESEKFYDYLYSTSVSNIKYFGSDGTFYQINGNKETKKNNNYISINYNKKNSGSFYTASSVTSNNIESRDGLASSELGSYITPSFTLMPVTGPYDSAERLIVWNSKYFDLVKKKSTEWVSIGCGSELGYSCTKRDTFTLKYGIYKNNPEGIISDDLVNSVYFDDFIWYSSPEEAMSNGTISAICGLDTDVVGNRVHRTINPKFRIKEDTSLIGSVGIIVHRTRIFDTDREIVYEPNRNSNYAKTLYNSSGELVSNHSGSSIGLSVLLLGNKTSVTTTVDDLDDDDNPKKNYDISDKELNIKILPKLINSNYSEVLNSFSDSVEVKSVLPKELSYVDGSSNISVDSVTKNNDGTTTLLWKCENWKANSEHECSTITYKAEISSLVDNNSKLIITSSAYNKYDLRDLRFRNSDYEIYVSNLSGSRASKDVDNTTLDVGEAFEITNKVGNISNSKLKNVSILEILPKTNFNGSYEIEIINLNSKQKLYYTTHDLDDLNLKEDVNGRKILKKFDSSLWIEVKEKDVIPEDATCLLSLVDVIDSQDEFTYTYNIIPKNNKVGDSYSFSMNVTCSNFKSAIKTNVIDVSVVDRSISGYAFIDINGNDKLDTEDRYFSDLDVYLYDEDDIIVNQTKTDSNGKYTFSSLSKGNYYVKVDIPKGYNIIDNCSSSIIEHFTERSIENINFGFKLKNVKVITHYYYENTTDSIGSDRIDTYLYGSKYKTYSLENIPVNYELKNVVNAATGTAFDDETVVIYYYGIKNSIITDSIVHTGSSEIENDNLEYEVVYNVDIKDYIGDAKVYISAELPYDIDLSKSYLDGGYYDKNNHTISWLETIFDINTYINSFSTSFKKNIKLVYIGYDEYFKSINNNFIGKTVLLNNQSESSSSGEVLLRKTTNSKSTNIVNDVLNDIDNNMEESDNIDNEFESDSFNDNSGYKAMIADNVSKSSSLLKYILVFSFIIFILISAFAIKKFSKK